MKEKTLFRVIQLVLAAVFFVAAAISHPFVSPLLMILGVVGYVLWWDVNYNRSNLFHLFKKDDDGDNPTD